MSRASLSTVLLVDGYNVIGAWNALKLIRDRDGLEPARWQLIESLTNYSSYNGFITQIVFDAYYQNTPSKSEVVTENLSVHYTSFGQTADSFIEMTCAKFRNDIRKFHQRLVVATSDRAQQMTVVGYGAEWISALRLVNEVEAMSQSVKRRQKSVKKSSGRFLAKSLDPLAQQRLAQMRLGLDP
ncbi:MAG: NYN domain-containing protein [Desertifilum sp. SIO1I2]|nr:NYN domain-containing protein [Desertifilum sp. SIO1I2]